MKTHDLAFLANKVNLPTSLVGNCKELTLVYLHVRYPDTPEIKDIKEKARRYVQSAEEILLWVKEQL